MGGSQVQGCWEPRDYFLFILAQSQTYGHSVRIELTTSSFLTIAQWEFMWEPTKFILIQCQKNVLTKVKSNWFVFVFSFFKELLP